MHDLIELKQIIDSEFSYANLSEEKIINKLNSENTRIFKKTISEKITGFIEIELKEGIGTINGIAVKKEYRRKGIGKELFEYALKFMKKNQIGLVKLLVKENNNTAKELYKKYDFLFSGIHPRKIENTIIEVWEKII